MNSESSVRSSSLSAPESRSVVVAMSGGVDSSVAAHLLAQAGDTLVGVSMQVWDYKRNSQHNSRATCCSPADFCDARRVAAALNIPYYVVDFEATFEREVIQRFVESYQQGVTPNPCIDCNSKVKFRELRERALTFGCPYVATGHYARIHRSPEGYHLLRGRDIEKDQSYFLYTCRQEELATTLFPVGEYTKAEVRALARDAGLVTAEKPESQDICFVAGSVQDFVTNIGGGRRRGSFVTRAGEVVGEHEGIHRYTVGQRRGLSIGGTAEPLYVLEIDGINNRIVVGPKHELRRESFRVQELHCVSPKLLRAVQTGPLPLECEVTVQVRSRHRGVPARLRVLDHATAEVLWNDEWAAVSPGQAAVFYDCDNSELLGGGRIAPAQQP